MVLNDAEKESLVRDLGKGEALILRNHGALVVGRTVGEAFNWTHRLELACRSQVAAMSCNTKLREVPQAVLEETWNNYQPGTRRPYGLMEWARCCASWTGWTRATALISIITRRAQ